jgi:ribosomal protein L3 glutamine methyltransferase
MTTVMALIEAGAVRLADAGVAFGHGTDNAFDEAAWLVLWRLSLPLDCDLDAVGGKEVSPADAARVDAVIAERIASRKPAAYLTREAWLQGLSFYVDERAIVPRSFIAELLVEGDIDPWLGEHTRNVLDLCTGNGSLAVLAAMTYPDVRVDAADLSIEALEVAAINVTRHRLDDRIKLIASDGMAEVGGPYDLILCNPPYVNEQSMSLLPPEYRAEPDMALAGGPDGMDFIRRLLADAPAKMSERAVLVLEIGNERDHFEAAFPQLEAVWLETSAGDAQVLLLARESLLPA